MMQPIRHQISDHHRYHGIPSDEADDESSVSRKRKSLEAPETSDYDRLVSKGGRCNVTLSNLSSRKLRYLTDFFNTVVDMKWRYNVVFFVSSFIGSWMLFGLLWWLTAILNFDMRPSSDEPCVEQVRDFSSAFLFSFETQQAIGYGTRVLKYTCPGAVLLFLVQSLVGLIIECVVVGLIFVKLSRPKPISWTIMFSRTAVICRRDGRYCLLFRAVDIRRSHLVQTSLRAVLVRKTTENDSTKLIQMPLELEAERVEKDDFLFLAWPLTIVHWITDKSPLWTTSKEELEGTPMEIIVILEGIVEISGKNLQVRTSYVQSEILWGANLTPLRIFKNLSGRSEVDFNEFHRTYPVNMPSVSAEEYSQDQKEDQPPEDEKENDDHEKDCEHSSLASKSQRWKTWKMWKKVKPKRSCL